MLRSAWARAMAELPLLEDSASLQPIWAGSTAPPEAGARCLASKAASLGFFPLALGPKLHDGVRFSLTHVCRPESAFFESCAIHGCCSGNQYLSFVKDCPLRATILTTFFSIQRPAALTAHSVRIEIPTKVRTMQLVCARALKVSLDKSQATKNMTMLPAAQAPSELDETAGEFATGCNLVGTLIRLLRTSCNS